MCNGPSLNKVDFNALIDSGAVIFGLNKINLIFDRTRMRPDLIVCVNTHVIEQNLKFFAETDIPLYLSKSAAQPKRLIKNDRHVRYLYQFEAFRAPSTDIAWSVHTGCTVTTVAIQIAMYLGIRDLSIVGCDHNFHDQGRAHAEVSAGAEDQNHFDKRYFSGGVTWQLPDLLESELYYRKCGEIMEDLGGRIVNSTVGGKLEVFERVPLESFLEE